MAEKQRAMFYVGQFAQFTLRAFWLVLCIPRSDDAPACQVALPNARGACLLPATNRNADSIASSALTKFASGKAKTLAGLYCLRTTSTGGHRTQCAWRALPSTPTPTQGGRRSKHGCSSVYVSHGPCSGDGGNLLWVEREVRGSTTGSGRQSGVSPKMAAVDYVTVRHHTIVVKTTYVAHPRLAKTVIENAWGQLSVLIYCVDCCAIGGGGAGSITRIPTFAVRLATPFLEADCPGKKPESH